MVQSKGVRIDKFLWAVRIYKTRSEAARMVKAAQILHNDREVKAAADVRPGDHISVKRNPIWRRYEILELLDKRVGAALVAAYIKDITSSAELEKLELIKQMPGYDRKKGAGRPTKKERRSLDDLREW